MPRRAKQKSKAEEDPWTPLAQALAPALDETCFHLPDGAMAVSMYQDGDEDGDEDGDDEEDGGDNEGGDDDNDDEKEGDAEDGDDEDGKGGDADDGDDDEDGQGDDDDHPIHQPALLQAVRKQPRRLLVTLTEYAGEGVDEEAADVASAVRQMKRLELFMTDHVKPPDEGNCEEGEMEPLAQALGAKRRLKTVNVTGFTGDDIRHLAGCSSLTNLCVSSLGLSCDETYPPAGLTAVLEACPLLAVLELQRIQFSGWDEAACQAFAAALGNAHRLRHLTLDVADSDSFLRRAVAPGLARRRAALHSLTLRGLSEVGARSALEALAGEASACLGALHLEDARIPPDEALKAVSSGVPLLTGLADGADQPKIASAVWARRVAPRRAVLALESRRDAERAPAARFSRLDGDARCRSRVLEMLEFR